MKVHDTIRTYCVLPSESALIGVTLWVAYTHLITSFDFAPRLVVRSAMKRSGKSRLLEVVTELVHNPIQTISATTPYIFRSIDPDEPPTLLFDEADTIFGTKVKAEQNEDLRALLNAGFRQGNFIGRTVGPSHAPQQFATFAPAAVAGIGRMPDTIEDRAIVVVMKRRKTTETVQQFRLGTDVPVLHAVREDIAAWAAQVRDTVAATPPTDIPVTDRAADVWEPLIAVADAAGGRWPEMARMAAKALCDASGDDDSDNLATALLADIKEVFDNHPGVSFLPSQALCDELKKVDEAPWAQFDLSPTKLGMKLKDHRIRARRRDASTVPGDRKRGYHRADFLDVWERHLDPDSEQEAG